jgi:chemotaxis protein CheC
MPSTARQLNEMQVDVLREVANIGTGHAVTSLTTMTGESFSMSVPAFGMMVMNEFESILGDLEALAASVYMPVEGDVCGHVAFLFPYDSACQLTDLLLGREHGTTTVLEELECSALMEVGNVLISSFLNAISDLTALSLPSSPPGIAIDMTGAILASILTISPNIGDHALTIMTRLADTEYPVEGVFVFIPEPDSLAVLFQALGIES